MIDCLPLPAILTSWETMLYSNPYICIITSKPMNCVTAPVAPASRHYCVQVERLVVLLQSHSIMAYKSISKFTESQPISTSQKSLDRSLQVHIQSHSITGSNCISDLVQPEPPGGSPNLLDRGHQGHLQTRSFMASQCIPEFPPSTFSGAP
jgi:hypothetical protein